MTIHAMGVLWAPESLAARLSSPGAQGEA